MFLLYICSRYEIFRINIWNPGTFGKKNFSRADIHSDTSHVLFSTIKTVASIKIIAFRIKTSTPKISKNKIPKCLKDWAVPKVTKKVLSFGKGIDGNE